MISINYSEKIENTSARIANNTLMLYFRMALIMLTTLYTSRVVLITLGVNDYGIYNVVGGIVAMFGFFNGAMVTATQRYISFALGKNDLEQLKRIYSATIVIHFGIALFIFILAETVGIWFLNKHINIPSDRLETARWVFHFSVFSFLITIVQVPFNALIIAYERMKIYALFGIIEVIIRLFSIYMLVILSFDKLKLYSLLCFIILLFVAAIYIGYSRIKFKYVKFKLVTEGQLYKSLLSYSGWNILGNISYVIVGQGTNILLNIFFGPVVNAARGIAYQINSAVNEFVVNFQMAVNPQIIKSYAANNLLYMHSLIIRGAKFSFILFYGLSLPIMLETEIILKIWLKIVPDYTIVFIRLILIGVLIDCISGPLITAAQATGKIKVFQGVVGGLLILNLPISYIFIKLGYPPQISLYIQIFISLVALIARLMIVLPLVELKFWNFINQVIMRLLLVGAISTIPPLLIQLLIEPSLLRFIIICLLSFISIFTTSYLLGLNQEEQHFFKNKIKGIIQKVQVASSIKVIN